VSFSFSFSLDFRWSLHLTIIIILTRARLGRELNWQIDSGTNRGDRCVRLWNSWQNTAETVAFAGQLAEPLPAYGAREKECENYHQQNICK